MTDVAVLGAGFQGVCAALELAARGLTVDLYDRCDSCVTQAGARNEGKIHLGFVYANDSTFDTTRLLARGALTFDRAVRRWLECEIDDVGLSTPHYYAVHRDSMLQPKAVLAHFARVTALVREIGQAESRTYLGQPAASVGFDLEEQGDIYDPADITAVIRTDERAVDVKRMAALLRARVCTERRISFHPCTEVVEARRSNGAIEVSLSCDGAGWWRCYRQVVNCLWDGKLAIDSTMGFLPGYRTLHRLKFGVSVLLREPLPAIPSATFVVGPFGDIVQIDERRFYFSWYPVARRGISRALTPPDWPRDLYGADATRMIEETLEAFARLVTPVRHLHPDMFEDVTVSGGVVVAAGESDIDDPRSQLHGRTSVGIRSRGGYHSVDTGKYTLAPMYAIEIADRVCGTA